MKISMLFSSIKLNHQENPPEHPYSWHSALSSAAGHPNTKQAQETLGTYSHSVFGDVRGYKTYWLRLQAKHDKSVWYNLTKEFTQNGKFTHFTSQGGTNYRSKEATVAPTTLLRASELCIRQISQDMTYLLLS